MTLSCKCPRYQEHWVVTLFAGYCQSLNLLYYTANPITVQLPQQRPPKLFFSNWPMPFAFWNKIIKMVTNSLSLKCAACSYINDLWKIFWEHPRFSFVNLHRIFSGGLGWWGHSGNGIHFYLLVINMQRKMPLNKEWGNCLSMELRGDLSRQTLVVRKLCF